ncbi:uncharacterized protein V1518DRAFT_413766 [Limtongia smithiae]|uniref:uncharacterized protein n=1 Tax=Limtongia smithiae TaxID=1125753 RepID=UPI0034CF3DBE
MVVLVLLVLRLCGFRGGSSAFSGRLGGLGGLALSVMVVERMRDLLNNLSDLCHSGGVVCSCMRFSRCWNVVYTARRRDGQQGLVL